MEINNKIKEEPGPRISVNAICTSAGRGQRMNMFKAAFINEIERMYKKKKALVVLILSIVVIVLGQLVVFGVRQGFGVNMANNFPLMVLSVFSNTILPLFTALVAIDIFAGEFSHNTMKIALLRPVSRLKLYYAKISAVAFFALANLLTVMVLTTLVGVVFSPSSFSLLWLWQIIISYIITFIPITAMAVVIAFLANLFKSSSGVFFLSIIIFIGFNVLAMLYSQYSSLFITSTLNWYNFWIENSIPAQKVLREFFIMLGYGIMFFTAGFYLFEKKDL